MSPSLEFLLRPLRPVFAISVLAFTASSAAGQCPNDDGLANNTTQTAFPLPPGASVFPGLAILGVGGSDFDAVDPGNDLYSFDLAPGQGAQFLAETTGPLGIYMQVYEAGSFVFAAGTNPNSSAQEIDLVNQGASVQGYILRVTSAAGSCRDYDLVSRLTVCPQDDLFENFDDCDSAALLDVMQPPVIYDRLGVSIGDDDWWDLPLSPGETLEMEIQFSHATADVDLVLRDASNGSCGATLATSTSVTDNERIVYTNATSSFMTVRAGVTVFSGGPCADYALEWVITATPADDVFEENDDICAPAMPPIGHFADLRVFGTDEDHYEVAVVPGERFRFVIDFSHAAGDLDMQLYDVSSGCASPVLVDSSTSITNQEAVEWTNSGSGIATLVARVFLFGGGAGNNTYDMTIGAARASDTGEVVCNGEPNSAGLQAYLYGAGSDVVADNDLSLFVQDLPPNQFGIFATSRSFGFVPNPGGSTGNICINDSTLGRFVGPGEIQNSGASGVTFLDLDLTDLPQGAGRVSALPGEAWYFQFWYRDSVGGAATSNFSTALRVDMR